MNLFLAEQQYPRVFAVLREHGWVPNQQREIPYDHTAVADECGYLLHDEAKEFLQFFAGLNFLHFRIPGNPNSAVSISVSLGELPRQMRLKYDAMLIETLAGTCDAYPVMNTGSTLVFMNPDGKVMGVVHDFAQVSYDADVFSFMHALFFREVLPGGSSRFLSREERPYEFRPGV
jgi:hypothetical protein